MNKKKTQAFRLIFVIAITTLAGFPNSEAIFVPEECVTAEVQGISPFKIY
jgi:hypothetical protein